MQLSSTILKVVVYVYYCNTMFYKILTKKLIFFNKYFASIKNHFIFASL